MMKKQIKATLEKMQKVDLKQKIRRGGDEQQDLLAQAHTMFPDAADPIEEIEKGLEVEGIYDDRDHAESEEIEQDYASVNRLIENEKIGADEALRLLDVLDARTKAFKMKMAEKVADRLDVDVKDVFPHEDDER
jgi:hypothetical protein